MIKLLHHIQNKKHVYYNDSDNFDSTTNFICDYVCITQTTNVFGPGGVGMHSEGFGPGFWHGPFALARIVPIVVFLVWLGIGIRQWFLLSKWTKKYERYKELQRKVNEKLDYEGKKGFR